MAEILRGELWWANLPEPFGSEPGFRRPVVIVQAGEFNRSAVRTVIVAAVTSNLRWADAPGNVFLSTDVSGLRTPSVINVLQLSAIDRTRLSECISRLPDDVMAALDNGLRLALEL
ncbi:MAG: type II toxin-antitoxin system PemK/MazF family toxin [Bryobacteraceae bacterium]